MALPLTAARPLYSISSAPLRPSFDPLADWLLFVQQRKLKLCAVFKRNGKPSRPSPSSAGCLSRPPSLRGCPRGFALVTNVVPVYVAVCQNRQNVNLSSLVSSGCDQLRVALQCGHDKPQSNGILVRPAEVPSGGARLSPCLFCASQQTDDLQSSNSDTVFFRDGIRRIDFVLAYVDDKDVEKRQVRDKCRAFAQKKCSRQRLWWPRACRRWFVRHTNVLPVFLLLFFSGEEEGV